MANAQWALFVDPEDKDQIAHLIIKDPNERIPTKAEMERVVRILNEEGSNIIRLTCEGGCGGWIDRTRKDADKLVFWCEKDTCKGKKFVR